MISYCVDINYEYLLKTPYTIFGDFEYDHYKRLGHASSTELEPLVHPELQFIVIF